MRHTVRVHRHHTAVCRLISVWLLVHGAAVSWILVGGEQLVHVDSDGRQCAVQLLDGLLRQGGFPAQDPGKLHMQHTEVGAAVDQRVVVVVGGQHPVRGRGRVWRCKGTGQSVFKIYVCSIVKCKCPRGFVLVINKGFLLSKKETKSLAGSEGSFAMAEPLMELMVPSALKENRQCVRNSNIHSRN